MNHWFFWTFLTLFIVHEIWEMGLTFLNRAHVNLNRHEIPEFFKDKVTPEEYSRSIHYTLDKTSFGITVRLISIVVIWTAILSGFFNLLDLLVVRFAIPGTLTHSVAYVLALGLIAMMLGIPASLYNTFVIEARYGFNKTTGKLFIKDLVKGLVLSAVLGIPLLYLIFWLHDRLGESWWLWAFLTFFIFQIFIAAIYPAVLAPLFNKFTPLTEGELKKSIEAIARKIGFRMSGIYTIDGSKRSGHSNAYFAGMGRLRRIVLFDTLEKQMAHPEIIAVLAHEMGHNIKKHIQKMMILSFFFSLAGFWILSLLMNWEPFFQTFNAGSSAPHKALVLFALFSGYFTFLLTPLINALSRRNEYEADRFSVEQTGDASSMASALVKLSKENLSNLTPHPLYSFYHYSHPTTEERVRAIRSLPHFQ